MDGYLGMLTHDLILVIDISCCEVYHDVNNEHDINWNIEKKLDGIKTIIWKTARLLTKFNDQSLGNAKSWLIHETLNI